jgi:hypothetical protein
VAYEKRLFTFAVLIVAGSTLAVGFIPQDSMKKKDDMKKD